MNASRQYLLGLLSLGLLAEFASAQGPGDIASLAPPPPVATSPATAPQVLAPPFGT